MPTYWVNKDLLTTHILTLRFIIKKLLAIFENKCLYDLTCGKTLNSSLHSSELSCHFYAVIFFLGRTHSHKSMGRPDLNWSSRHFLHYCMAMDVGPYAHAYPAFPEATPLHTNV